MLLLGDRKGIRPVKILALTITRNFSIGNNFRKEVWLKRS